MDDDEFVDDFADQSYASPNAKSLVSVSGPGKDPWQCRVCHYWPNIDSRSPNCIQCGRDFYGNLGIIPDRGQLAIDDREKGGKK